ncbi:zinc finger protein 84-like [Ochlerotatus camptorhynchus]|uniref:zinc finger protein 84-like n=1 Tax=Ochlerotatus camptorhynchus TaxID=644619 RepID=UPI0031CEE4B1
MTAVMQAADCRICAKTDADNMESLYESMLDGKTPAQIIEECFNIMMISSDGLPSKLCHNCREDLKSVFRFHSTLLASEQKFKAMVTLPKIEITEPGDGNISSVFISEVYIKSEANSECEEVPHDNFDTDEDDEPIARRKSRNKRRKKEKDTRLDSESHNEDQELDIADESIDQKPIDGQDAKPDTSKPAKKRWIDITLDMNSSDDDSSSNDHYSDYDSANSSSGDGEDRKPKKKRLYYGVKADSQPKRCCDCKDFPLDSHEKVQEHSDKYHYRYRVTNERDIEENPFECPHCFKRFESKKEFLRHQRKMYVERLHPCPKCDEEFANQYVLQRHLKMYHKKKMIIERMEELRQESHICCACKKKFDSQEQLRAHADEVHLKESQTYDGEYEFECDVCYRRFKTRQSMKVHQYRMFKGKKFICALCGKAFKEKAFLRDHENSHRREKPYECPKCDARFSIKGSYDAHVRLHDAKDEFKCEYCGRGFRTKSLLKGHLTVHSEDRPFKCHLCPITFTQQRLLDSHIEFHLGNKPFKCQQCPASYRYQRDLRGHVREKHEGILNFQCTFCPKAFNRKKPLMVHLKTHEAI